MRITGGPVLLRWQTLSPLGVSAFCLSRAMHWSTMLWLRLGCGMWNLSSTYPLGSWGTDVPRFQASFGRIRRSLLLGQLLSRLLHLVVSLQWMLSWKCSLCLCSGSDASSRPLLLAFRFHSVFNFTPVEVCSRPFPFSPRVLPPSYQSLLLAWHSDNGYFSQSRSALVMASTDPYQSALASSMSAKSLYLYLLSAHFVPPHCEEFFPRYGAL